MSKAKHPNWGGKREGSGYQRPDRDIELDGVISIRINKVELSEYKKALGGGVDYAYMLRKHMRDTVSKSKKKTPQK